MIKHQLIKLLVSDYTSKSGSLKIKLMSPEIAHAVMLFTKDYQYTADKHMNVRCWMLLNNKHVPICLTCNNPFYPTTIAQFKSKQFCSVKCANNSASKKAKYIQTCQRKYGVDNIAQLEQTTKSKQDTCQRKYGYTSFSKTVAFKQQYINTMQERYGVDYAMQSTLLKTRFADTMYDFATFCKKVAPNTKFATTLFHKDEFNAYMKSKTIQLAATEIGVDPNTIRRYIDMHDVRDFIKYRSSLEVSMEEFLTEHNIKFDTNNRMLIKPKEVDFYLSDYKLAIEMNGNYYHSNIDRNYHYNKWKSVADTGNELVSISETDWVYNNEKIKAMLISKFKLQKITTGARKCKVSQIVAKEARLFVDTYHIQGFVAGTSYWGAFYNDVLVGVMIFGWTRGTVSSRRFELKRFVTDNNATYAGLFSKLFKHAYNYIGFRSVVSFSDNRYFTGNIYKVCGFSLAKIQPPSYQYLYKNKLVHCSNFTKSNIAAKFPHMKKALQTITEKAAMDILGIPRYYDCGKKEWVWSI